MTYAEEMVEKTLELDDLKELIRNRCEADAAEAEYEAAFAELQAQQERAKAAHRRMHMHLDRAEKAADRIMARRMLGTEVES